jgi:cell division protein FtsQ
VRSRSKDDSATTATDLTTSRAATDPAAERTRRRFARRQWRRRWLAWRFVLVILLVALLIGGGVWAVWFSSWLAVDQVEVSGAQTASADDIRARADIETGQQLVRVDLAEAAARVRSMAVVKTVEVTRQWPDRILVSIEERVAIAVVDIGGRLRGMDAEGVVFRDYKRAPPGLPRVETSIGTTSEALREAAAVISALPESLTLIVDHVLVETVDQISLVLRDGRVVIWGSSADSETKAEVLEELLKTPAQVYDVSVPSRPTTSP